MKLRNEMIEYLSRRVVEALEKKELLDTDGNEQGVIESISGVIIDDLMVEDDLNSEVKELLDEMGDEIDQANINYRKMFQMVKTKLARERGLIL